MLPSYVIRQAKNSSTRNDFLIYTPNTNALLMSQFCYCLFVWMNCSKILKYRINGLQRRALSVVYNEFSLSFSEILETDKSVTIHYRNLQTLAYEIFKVKNNMAPKILTKIFPLKESNYSLRTQRCRAEVLKLMYGSETISSLEPKIRGILPTELKKNCVSYTIQKKNS